MRPATPDDLPTITAAWHASFRHNDPFARPFVGGGAPDRLWFPSEMFHLSPSQFACLSAAAEAVSSSACIVSLVEGPDATTFLAAPTNHWLGSTRDAAAYRAMPLHIESAIYAVDGTWAVIISHEDHALVSGTVGFLAALDDRNGPWNADMQRLRRFWEDASRPRMPDRILGLT